MDERRHDWKELKEYPVFKSTKEWSPNWSHGVTGDGKLYVGKTQSDGSEDVYILPEFIHDMMKRERERGADEARAAMRRALGF